MPEAEGRAFIDVRALHPNIAYPKQRFYFDVERKEGNASKVVYNDAGWATKFYFKQALLPVLPDRIELVCETTGEDKPGIYRLKHSSFYKSADGKEVPYSVSCRPSSTTSAACSGSSPNDRSRNKKEGKERFCSPRVPCIMERKINRRKHQHLCHREVSVQHVNRLDFGHREF